MADKEFDTPQDALAHYGKKGMRWGIRNDDKPKGDGGNSKSKPSEKSKDDLAKSLDDFYSKKTPDELKAEGQKKLQAQAAESGFRTKREVARTEKADKLEAQADSFASQAKKLEVQRDALPEKGYMNRVKRANLNAEIRTYRDFEADARKEAGQLREGKLTDKQKMLIGIGAAAAVTGLALYGNHKYTEHKAGLSADVKKRMIEENHAKSTEQWKELFGDDPNFTTAKGGYIGATMGGSFYRGLGNNKALDRPEFVIPKTTMFQRLSNHEEDSSEYGKVKGAYATFLHNDKKIYGASGEFGGAKHTINFTAKDDVRVPRLSTVYAHLKQVMDQESPGYPTSDAMVVSKYHSMAGGSWSDGTSMRLFSSLKSFGYSAIVDDMDAGYLGDLPVVFFGDANPATATPRTNLDSVRDSVGVLHLSGQYA